MRMVLLESNGLYTRVGSPGTGVATGMGPVLVMLLGSLDTLAAAAGLGADVATLGAGTGAGGLAATAGLGLTGLSFTCGWVMAVLGLAGAGAGMAAVRSVGMGIRGGGWLAAGV